jgi:hypothetical protein
MNMRAILITLNWAVPFLILGTVNMDESPLWVMEGALLWFASASFLMNYANERGWLDGLKRRLDSGFNGWFRDL